MLCLGSMSTRQVETYHESIQPPPLTPHQWIGTNLNLNWCKPKFNTHPTVELKYIYRYIFIPIGFTLSLWSICTRGDHIASLAPCLLWVSLHLQLPLTSDASTFRLASQIFFFFSQHNLATWPWEDPLNDKGRGAFIWEVQKQDPRVRDLWHQPSLYFQFIPPSILWPFGVPTEEKLIFQVGL